MSVVTRFKPPSAERVRGGNPILVVDDEPAFGGIVRALIAGTGYAVDAAPDAPAAFHAVRLREYSLILMDIEMAGITGLRGAARIRQTADWTRRVPIIAFTSHRPPRGERFFLERDFDGWLPKPFTVTDLFGVLKRWLSVEGADAALAAEPGLGQIMGREQLDAMIARLRHGFAQAIAAIDAGADPAPYGHRLGGLSGTLGLTVLSTAWLALEEHSKVWDTVRGLTLEWLDKAD
ncbi:MULTISPECIES: response regulator [unclassified Sphingomonas]|uniref:response regulator n=1 Tax=unclassified Sphingomonas TaxID=196159 RepID=UPI0006F610BE|nr:MULTISPECIES: response regulator [unclassified Sphingomonas]KQX25074.1 response regulator receiver protein [Sphingomonas sp. Root1294]KQY66091.1 response regulator receiver protein [Sphingomonas sp. Root50]KRB89745.1 response regulator receiver protein [Sphingomonas sp. Root720]